MQTGNDEASNKSGGRRKRWEEARQGITLNLFTSPGILFTVLPFNNNYHLSWHG